MIAILARALIGALLVLPLGTSAVLAEGHVEAVTHGALRIENAWTRQTPPGARAGGGYVTITNTGEEVDRLIGGSAPFAERFELHEMSVADGGMRMKEIEGGLAIGPGETVVLEPGGAHLMFLGLTEPPVAGSKVAVTLRFERAGEVTLDAWVAPIGARSPDATASGHGRMREAETHATPALDGSIHHRDNDDS